MKFLALIVFITTFSHHLVVIAAPYQISKNASILKRGNATINNDNASAPNTYSLYGRSRGDTGYSDYRWTSLAESGLEDNVMTNGNIAEEHTWDVNSSNIFCLSNTMLHPIAKAKSIYDECDESPSRCSHYGTCCSNLSTFSVGLRTFGTVCRSSAGPLPGYFSLRICPPTFSEKKTRTLCEENLSISQTTIDTVSMVTDSATGLTYFNKYCAKCNDVKEMVAWNTSLVCDTYVHVFGALSNTQFLRLGMQNTSTCKVEHIPVDNDTHATPCEPQLYVDNSEVVSTCYVTGQETSDIERGCLMSSMEITSRLAINNKTYKNFYCFLCNEVWTSAESKSIRIMEGRKHIPAFTFLFGFREESADRSPIGGITTCNDDEWEDPQRTCRKVLCTAGKILKEDRCVTAMDQIKGLPYRLGFWLLPSGPSKRSLDHGDLKFQSCILHSELKKMLQTLSKTVLKLDSGIAHSLDLHSPSMNTLMTESEKSTFYSILSGKVQEDKIKVANSDRSQDKIAKRQSRNDRIMLSLRSHANTQDEEAGHFNPQTMRLPNKVVPAAGNDDTSSGIKDDKIKSRARRCGAGEIEFSNAMGSDIRVLRYIAQRREEIIKQFIDDSTKENPSKKTPMDEELRGFDKRNNNNHTNKKPGSQGPPQGGSVHVGCEGNICIKEVHDGKKETTNTGHTSIAWVMAHIESDPGLSRDDFEYAIAKVLRNQTMHVQNKCFDYEMHLTPHLMLGNINAHEIEENCNNDHVDSLLCSSTSETLNSELPLSDYLWWTMALTCPYIEIYEDQITVTFSNNSLMLSSLVTSIQIKFGSLVVEFTDPFELNQISQHPDRNDTFHVCKQLLDTKITNALLDDLTTYIQFILNDVMLSTSVLCLLATVTTYCLFPYLRCVAGCNTMGLSLSLAGAQVSVLVLPKLSQRITTPPACIVVGIIIHYTWLWFFTWSLVCCLHMLQVFTTNVRQARRENSGETKRKAINASLSFLIPVLVIAITIVTSYEMHGTVGYGTWSCRYDDTWAVCGPLIAVTIINTICYVIVVFKIWNVRRLQTNRNFRTQDRNDLLIYVKLSSFTGLFWFLNILSEFFDLDILRFIATVINGSQGIFIFCSFILNRRVLGLYANRFESLKFLDRKTTTGTTTTDK